MNHGHTHEVKMATFTLDRLLKELADLRSHCSGDTPVIVEVEVNGKRKLMDAFQTGFVDVIPSGNSIRTGYRVPVNAQDERDVRRIQTVIVH
jgi:hypothetical protein